MYLLVGAPGVEAEGSAQEVAHRLGPFEVVPGPVVLGENAFHGLKEATGDDAGGIIFSRDTPIYGIVQHAFGLTVHPIVARVVRAFGASLGEDISSKEVTSREIGLRCVLREATTVVVA